MSKIKKEQAKDLRNAFDCWQQDYDPVEDKEQYDMFGLGMVAMDALLASLEAEPVCVIDQSNLDYLNSGSDADVWPASRKEMGDVLLYRAAPPASVSVPTFEEWCERTQQNPLGWVRDAMKEAYDGCRATMLQGADGTLTNEGTIPGGNSPVIPAGWVLVPVEPTAEMLQSGISAHYERSKIQIHDRPAPGPMDFAYVAMLAAAPQQEVK